MSKLRFADKETIAKVAQRVATEELIRRLNRIAEIIERVDTRCLACDGPVTPTLQEMTQQELSEIYKLAKLTPAVTSPQDQERS